MIILSQSWSAHKLAGKVTSKTKQTNFIIELCCSLIYLFHLPVWLGIVTFIYLECADLSFKQYSTKMVFPTRISIRWWWMLICPIDFIVSSLKFNPCHMRLRAYISWKIDFAIFFFPATNQSLSLIGLPNFKKNMIGIPSNLGFVALRISKKYAETYLSAIRQWNAPRFDICLKKFHWTGIWNF